MLIDKITSSIYNPMRENSMSHSTSLKTLLED